MKWTGLDVVFLILIYFTTCMKYNVTDLFKSKIKPIQFIKRLFD